MDWVQVGEALKNLIGSGRTRFLMVGIGITAICFLAWKTEVNDLVYWLILALVGLFILSKTLTDLFGRGD
jgi:hypothetical protein